MIILSDRIEIDAPPSRVFQWFRQLQENYRSWHPDHVSCRYLRGGDLQKGSVFYVEEYLHGKLHHLKFSVTNVVPNQEFSYRILPGLRGGFRMRPTNRGTELVAEIVIGWQTRLIGALVDRLVRRLFTNHLEELARHMKEEGTKLRALLEEESPGPPSTSANVV